MAPTPAATWTCPDCQTVTHTDPDSEMQCDFCGLLKFEAEEPYHVCPKCGHSERLGTTHCGLCEARLPAE